MYVKVNTLAQSIPVNHLAVETTGTGDSSFSFEALHMVMGVFTFL